MNSIINEIKYNEKNLVPTIVQNYSTGDILMFAFSNQESLEKTIFTNYAHFWSRSRKKLWKKGEESGNVLKIKNIYIDCDKDCILFTTIPDGPTCHTKKISCFHTDIDEKVSQKPLIKTGVIEQVFSLIEERKDNTKKINSYTSSLFKEGLDKILSKIKEECDESIEASKFKNKENIIYEFTDLLYHMMVALSFHDINIQDIFQELEKRIGKKKKDYTLDE